MVQRLHKKKCKKTGRTEEGQVKTDVARKMKQFAKINSGNSTFLPAGKKAPLRTSAGLDGEVANLERDQRDQKVIEEAFKLKIQAIKETEDE